MNDLPPCTADPVLFASRNAADHAIARAYCQRCPVIDWCADEYKKAVRLAARGDQEHNGPTGTWAGQLIYGFSKTRAACGTNSGYYRHIRAQPREEPCDGCREAHATSEQRRNKNKGAA